MVFQNLADIQGIEDWSFGEDPWSEDQKAFERQWRKLPALYRQSHAALLGDGLATRAQLTRRVAEGEQQLDVDHVLAAGLATMSQAEWKCLNRWHAQHNLTLLWDADASYVDDVHNEAGLFVRKYRGSTPRSPERPWRRTHRGSRWSPVLRPQAKPSTSATCSGLAPEELDRTLLVLPDGSSLGTLLQALPMQSQGINVTMGLPSTRRPLCRLSTTCLPCSRPKGWPGAWNTCKPCMPILSCSMMGPAGAGADGPRHPQAGQGASRLGQARRFRGARCRRLGRRLEAPDPAQSGRCHGFSRGLVRMGQST